MEPFPAVDRSDLVGIVLAAGEGRRLSPLTDHLTKALCPVGGVPLVDLAIDRVAPHVAAVAVNAHHDRDRLVAHLHRRADVAVSVEPDEALGTAGAVARLGPWTADRSVVVVNADGWTTGSLAPLLAGWDRTAVRVLVAGDDVLGDRSPVVACALPAAVVGSLVEHPSGLFETVWRPAREADVLEVVRFDDVFIDCGTPSDYLAANLAAVAAAGGPIIGLDVLLGPHAHVERSVVGAGARIDGSVVDSVVWDGQSVGSAESLVRAIRVGPSTTVTVDDGAERDAARN